MDKFSELKVTIPADKKSRESVAAGYVTDNNSGGYFVIECQECGAVYPSQQADGGGQIADTGDYNDAICPHCGEEGPEECENVGLAWNVQQAKIIALLAELEASKTNAEYYKSAFEEQRDHADMLEKRLATPVRLGAGVLMVSAYSANSCDSEWHFCLARDSVVSAIRAAGFTVEGDE